MCLLLSVLPEKKKPQPKHGEVKLETLLGFSHSLVVPTDRQYSSQIIPFSLLRLLSPRSLLLLLLLILLLLLPFRDNV